MGIVGLGQTFHNYYSLNTIRASAWTLSRPKRCAGVLSRAKAEAVEWSMDAEVMSYYECCNM